jgi:hypothetical protein
LNPAPAGGTVCKTSCHAVASRAGGGRAPFERHSATSGRGVRAPTWQIGQIGHRRHKSRHSSASASLLGRSGIGRCCDHARFVRATRDRLFLDDLAPDRPALRFTMEADGTALTVSVLTRVGSPSLAEGTAGVLQTVTAGDHLPRTLSHAVRALAAAGVLEAPMEPKSCTWRQLTAAQDGAAVVRGSWRMGARTRRRSGEGVVEDSDTHTAHLESPLLINPTIAARHCVHSPSSRVQFGLRLHFNPVRRGWRTCVLAWCAHVCLCRGGCCVVCMHRLAHTATWRASAGKLAGASQRVPRASCCCGGSRRRFPACTVPVAASDGARVPVRAAGALPATPRR